LSDRLYRVERCRFVRLESIVQAELLRDSLLMPFPAKRLVAIGRFGTMHGSLESYIGFIGFDPGGTPSPDAMRRPDQKLQAEATTRRSP
jgi:hypothetical protein